jgi:hypothetical protein
MPPELWEFIEIQNPVMGEGDLTGLWPGTAACEGNVRYGVMGIPEGSTG